MAHIGLVSCVSKKGRSPAQARELYDSPLFAKARAYVERYCDRWFILSAKHGLLEPTAVVEPYEETLGARSRDEREAWAERVWHTLQPRLGPSDRITVLAGERYREFLLPRLQAYGLAVDVPMKGMGIGRQLQWLSERLEQPRARGDMERLYRTFHDLEAGLGGKRLLSTCSGRQHWPRGGVYLLYEPGEVRTGSGEPRVVRVGTHGVSRGSKATLWNRLRTHRGTGDGRGNHRSSIFRLHVGAALAARDPAVSIQTWGVGESADAAVRRAEESLERLVSAHIGAMHVLWLAIEDSAGPASDRAFIERNLIGLLAGARELGDPPTAGWLGLHSPDRRIRDSGLWNLDFLDHGYSVEFLDILEEYVLITTGRDQQPTRSLAPADWYVKERERVSPNQLSLFRGPSRHEA